MEQLALLAPAPGSEAWCARFNELHVDLGTGDARYALRLARQRADLGVVGVDTCLDHVRGHARQWPANLALVQCDAAALPDALDGRVNRISVNFPYGGLLTGLLDGDEAQLARLGTVLAMGGGIEVRINASVLAGTGHSLATAEEALSDVCRCLGCDSVRCRRLDAAELRRFPSTWAKRIGFGREAVAIEVVGGCRVDGAPGALLP